MEFVLSFVASRKSDSWSLHKGVINYNIPGDVVQEVWVETDNIRAAKIKMDRSDCELGDVIGSLLDGVIEIRGCRYYFQKNADDFYDVKLDEAPGGVSSRQLHVHALTLIGGLQNEIINRPSFDWELRSHSEPYDGMIDLLQTVGIAITENTNASFEVRSPIVVAIDTRSMVRGSRADVKVRLVKGLDFGKAAVGYRILANGSLFSRGVWVAGHFKWEDEGNVCVGSGHFDVPPAALIQAFASYDGKAFHSWWIHDPDKSQNPRRAALEVYDPGLKILTGYLRGEGSDPGKDLEFAVSWLVWLLGFSPSHLGVNSKMKDAVDILVSSPEGNIALVECTTGVLKAGHKPSVLLGRAAAVRASLNATNNSHIKVYPIMVTTKLREEILPEIKEVMNSGVYVLTRDDLEALLIRTAIVNDANILLAEIEQVAESAANV
ncbi:hypothetical protein [Sphingomonas trueperi]|uniref:hypothetical protein n=1 Tax=Sphingomonas trueperi TaxID=53317 RepID=UPI00339341AB